MASVVVQLDDDAAERLRRRAKREGIEMAELARRLLAEASEQDPFEFVGNVSSDVLGAQGVDEFLEQHGFSR